MEHKARRILATAFGFLEVHNYGWMNDQWLAKLGFDPGETLVLQNPAAQPESRLRTTLIPNLLALIPKNRPFRDQFRIFELGHIYQLKGKVNDQTFVQDSADKCLELPRLAGISFIQSGLTLEDHYLQIKSAVEELGYIFAQNNKPLKFIATTQTVTPWQTADHSVDIYQDKVKIGALGVLDAQLMNVVLPEGGQVVWFEIELDQFDGTLYPNLKFVEPPKFPGSWQDFSLIWNIDDGYETLDAKLNEFSDPLLIKREFLTAYKGKGLEKGKASYSFRFIIGAENHTLSGDEIESFHQKFLTFLTSNEISLR